MSLYKYVRADRIDILKNRSIRFTPQSDLNDAFEMRPYFETVLDKEETGVQLEKTFYAPDSDSELPEGISSVSFAEIKAGLADSGKTHAEYLNTAIEGAAAFLREQITPSYRKDYYDNINATYGVLCLTERPDNLLMWGHYADGHRGFVIEFDDNHPFFHHESEVMPGCGFLRKVQYSRDRPNFKKFTDITFIEMLFAKSEDWQYEHEWRIANLLQEADLIQDHLDIGKLHFFNLPPDCIKGVIFGCKMPSEKHDCITNYIRSDPEYSGIKLSNAVINERTYDLDLIAI